MKFRIDVIENKNKIFLHVLKGNFTEVQARQEIKASGYDALELISSSEKIYIFRFLSKEKTTREVAVENLQKEEVKVTDLIESYGASELPPAPTEITDPEQEEDKTKPARRRRTRRKTTKTVKSSE